jgi:hypothetical protein
MEPHNIMQTYTGFVEDAKWHSRWKSEWKNPHFVDRYDDLFYDVDFPEFSLSTVYVKSTTKIVQLQLAMGIPPMFRQLEKDWEEASRAHLESKDIVFSSAHGDTIHVNGDCKPLPSKGIQVILKYRDTPRDISLYETLYKKTKQRLEPVRKRLRVLSDEQAKLQEKQYSICTRYEESVKEIRDRVVKASCAF